MSFDSGYSRRTLAGYQVLVSGFYGIAAGQFSWLANFPLAAVLIGLTSYSMSERATAWSAILLLALSADLLDFVIRPAFWGHSQLLIGGYLWLITNLISAAFALVATTSKLAIVK